MADDNNNCAIMLDAGALLHVVELTQVELSSTKMKCAAILSRLSLHEKYYSQFAQHDVLRVLLNLCSVDHIMTQRRLVIAISNLSQVFIPFIFLNFLRKMFSSSIKKTFFSFFSYRFL